MYVDLPIDLCAFEIVFNILCFCNYLDADPYSDYGSGIETLVI